MKKIIYFLFLICSLFFMSYKSNIKDKIIRSDGTKEIIEDQEQIDKESMNEKGIFAYDFNPSLYPLLQYDHVLSREEFFEVFGYYPGELGKDCYVNYGPEFQKEMDEVKN